MIIYRLRYSLGQPEKVILIRLNNSIPFSYFIRVNICNYSRYKYLDELILPGKRSIQVSVVSKNTASLKYSKQHFQIAGISCMSLILSYIRNNIMVLVNI